MLISIYFYSPIRDALGATKAAYGLVVGPMPSTATKRVDGTRRSEYLATSREAPKLSKAILHHWSVHE